MRGTPPPTLQQRNTIARRAAAEEAARRRSALYQLTRRAVADADIAGRHFISMVLFTRRLSIADTAARRAAALSHCTANTQGGTRAMPVIYRQLYYASKTTAIEARFARAADAARD